jgi:glycosyltransferase involved in cell wall biosynthesis
MKTPLVSICIPTYNQSEYLKKTLDSIVCQTFEDYEVIISDDSTDDQVKELLNNYSISDRLAYFKNEKPLGSPANWNNAIRKASGQFIKILHHDDYFSHKDSLLEFVKIVKEDPQIDFVFCSSCVIDLNKNKSYIYKFNKYKIIEIIKNPYLLLIGNLIGAPSVVFFKKSVTEFDINLKWLVDSDFYIRMLTTSKKTTFTHKPLVTITIGAEEQITRSCTNKNVEFAEWFYVYKKHKKDFPFNYKEKIHLLKLIYKYNVKSIDELENLYEQIPNKKQLGILIHINKIINYFNVK